MGPYVGPKNWAKTNGHPLVVQSCLKQLSCAIKEKLSWDIRQKNKFEDIIWEKWANFESEKLDKKKQFWTILTRQSKCKDQNTV